MAEDGRPNVFFGFDMVLTPIAIKGACGADITADLQQINTLIATYPDDAEESGVATQLDVLAQTAWATSDPSLIIGGLSSEAQSQLCSLARPLTLDLLTPDGRLKTATNPSPEQQEAWRQFWSFIESL